MPQPEVLKYVHDMIEAGRTALSLAEGISFEEYQQHPSVPLAVERQFITIGEALAQLSRVDPDLADQIPQARRIIGFRNILVHGYSVIDIRVVWEVLIQDLPVLISQLDALLRDK